MSHLHQTRPRAPRIAPVVEPIERRTLLAVSFTAGPLMTPANTADAPLGNILSFRRAAALGVNPTDAANVVMAAVRNMRISTDGGATYGSTVAYPIPAGASDLDGQISLAFDAEGRLFVSQILAYTSPDHRDVVVTEFDPATGQVIGTPAVFSNPAGRNDDAARIAADRNPASLYANRLYAAWSRSNVTPGQWEIMFSYSADRGASWSVPAQLSSFATDGLVSGVDVQLAPNGDVYVAYQAQPDMTAQTLEGNGIRHNPDGVSGRTFVRRSTDGGAMFGPKTEVFSAGQSDITFNTQDALNGGTIPGTRFWTFGSTRASLLADPVRPGHIYVIMADDPDNAHGTSDDADLVIARSTDHGQTWTRNTLESGANNSFQLFPTATIDRFGNIVVSWRDNRRGLTNADGRFLLDTMAKYSTDGGVTWSAPFFVNDSNNPFDPDVGAGTRFSGPPPTTQIGGRLALEVVGNTAHVGWTGNTATSDQIWYDRFAINGALAVTGDDAAALIADDIIVREMSGNSEFIEGVMNGQRQYAGLRAGLSGISIDAGADADSIGVSATGTSLPVTILPSPGNDAVSVNTPGAGAANVIFDDSQALGALTIGSGGAALLTADFDRVLSVTSLSITGSGQFDLADNSMIVDYTGASPIAQVQSALTSGYNNGAWNGPGINSSAAASVSGHSLGYAEATELFTSFPATFAAQQVDDTTILLTYTRYGDADLNRTVNLADFNRLASNFGQSNRRWSQGNFNYDVANNVNLVDFNLLAQNFGQSAVPASAPRSTSSDDADEQLPASR